MNATGPETRNDPDQIERDIEGIRSQISSTLDALESKLSPRQRLYAARDSLRQMGGRIARSSVDTMCPSITTMIRIDHTHVLALFRRFKPYTPPGRKRALVRNACLALEIHAQLEEEIFYPALQAATDFTDLIEKSIDEHAHMRETIAVLRGLEPDDSTFDDTFRGLIRAVLHHVADEETTLLPLAEEVLIDDLGTLGMQMTRRRLQLLGPHLGEVARTSARSFPLLTGAAAAGLMALAWLALRPVARRR